MVPLPENRFADYHAHVYFDERTIEQARELCNRAAALFGATMGRVHQKPVGPHPRWSCQLAFDAGRFDALVLWLDEHRGGLTILVHGRTGNAYADHTDHAAWLGEPVALNLAAFERKPDAA